VSHRQETELSEAIENIYRLNPSVRRLGTLAAMLGRERIPEHAYGFWSTNRTFSRVATIISSAQRLCPRLPHTPQQVSSHHEGGKHNGQVHFLLTAGTATIADYVLEVVTFKPQ
jgi:hypothetical protein